MDKVCFDYTNHRGRLARRTVRPIRVWFGSTAWYPEAQWLLEAWDLEKQATRDFALGSVSRWSPERTNRWLTPFEASVFELADKVALMLGCLRNYQRAGHQVDLDGAMTIQPEVMELLNSVRDQLPKPE